MVDGRINGPAEMRIVHRIGDRLDKLIRRVERLETRFDMLEGGSTDAEEAPFIAKLIGKGKKKHAENKRKTG
jgi:hypothetical protein